MKNKIPAIRATIGTWVYYVATLSFKDISEHVKRIDNELHQATCLSDAIQRSITNNYKEIKKYILHQDERFFNSLVLAIYDGNPEWVEVELELEGIEYFNMGFLSLTGSEKIFAVDGQHRVEGIKASLKEKPDLADDKIPVIFLGHKRDTMGMQKTRRLFSTLNRYAKPVSMSDIVALDEDDVAAIITRHLVESFSLFTGNRVVFSQQKAIPESNKEAITSLITLYQCNQEILKYYFKHVLKKTKKHKDTKQIDFFKYRPDNELLQTLSQFAENYWISFSKSLSNINAYATDLSDSPAIDYRNNIDGGDILFRPIGLLPFIKATLKEADKYNTEHLDDFNFDPIMIAFEKINYRLDSIPWKHVAWDPINKTMTTSVNQTLIKLLFFYLANINSQEDLTKKELLYIKNRYAASIGFEDDIDSISLGDLLFQ